MATSRVHLAAISAAVTAMLVALAIWTQSRLGSALLPHAFCITGSEPLLALHVTGDSLITLAYLLIPAALLNIIRQRKDIPFGWVALLFGAFILACGATHAVEVWTLWDPVYWYSGVLKAFTAAVSLSTAWVLFNLTPQILAIPSAGAMRSSNALLHKEVNARRGAEQALLQAQAELQALLERTSARARQASAVLDAFFDSAPIGLAIIGQNESLLRINGAFTALNAPARASPRAPATALRDLAPAVGTELARLVHDGRAVRRLEVKPAGPQEAERTLLASFFPIQGAGGVQYGCAMEDITYQRKVERERQQALKQAQDARDATEELNRDLEQRVETRTRELRSLLTEMESFSSSIAHDLRAPLTTLGGYSQVLMRSEKERLSPRGQEYLDKVVRAGARMDEIITALLSIARLPHQPLERVDVDMAQLAREVMAGLQSDEPQRRVEVLVLDTLPVVGDPVLLRQAMANLLGNCWKFSGREEMVRIEVGCMNTPRGKALFVRDHGAGFEADRSEHLFQMFHRMHSDTEFSGSGVGLAIVKRIVQRHGGDIWAESTPGEGACFYFTLAAET
jgi:signal transduction histidine kinase